MTIDQAMQAVWSLVRSGPNFDGRQKDVEAAIQAYGDARVRAALEAAIEIVEKHGPMHYWAVADIRKLMS